MGDDAGSAPVRWMHRFRVDGGRLAASLAVLAAATTLAATPPPGWEDSLFHAFNGLPDGMDGALSAVQLLGSAATMQLAAAVLWWLAGRLRPAAVLAVAGALIAWLAARVLEIIVAPPRRPVRRRSSLRPGLRRRGPASPPVKRWSPRPSPSLCPPT